MTTATTGNLAEQATDKDKEKIDKRRALGRGLASLLPGPRVVPQAPVAPVPAVGGHHAADAGGANPASSHSSAAVQAHAAELRSAGQPMAAVPTYSPAVPTLAPDMPQAVVWPEEPAHDSQAAEGTLTINATAESRIPGNLVVNLAIADIDKNPFQTRYVQDDDALEELAESIKANGVVQPIMVRPSEDEEGRYVLVLGERRLHASKKAGKTYIPALVRRVSRQQAAEMTIVENLQREDLSPLEQAESFRVLSNEFSLTQQEIGERVGLSRESVANYMRLLKLPREVMQMLGMLDEAIADLQAAAGRGRYTLSLSAFADPPRAVEPLLPPPTPKDAIEQVLAAARVTDSAADRTSLLSTAIFMCRTARPGQSRAPHGQRLSFGGAGSVIAPSC